MWGKKNKQEEQLKENTTFPSVVHT